MAPRDIDKVISKLVRWLLHVASEEGYILRQRDAEKFAIQLLPYAIPSVIWYSKWHIEFRNNVPYKVTVRIV